MPARQPKVCMRAICGPSARAHFPDTHDYFNLKILCLKYNPSGVGLVSVKTGLEVRKMRIACLGGGPAGLYFAISMKLRDPSHEIVVIERNKPDDTFGWGVVLSDETLDNLAENDAVSAESIRAHFAYWDDIAVLFKDTKTVSTGHGFCGIGRKQLLLLLQARAKELGVELRFETNVASAAEYSKDFDLVVASDGLNSHTRTEFADKFQPEIDVRKCQFVWLGTHQKFDDAFTFIFEETDKGWIWAHAYQFDDETATFIVECNQETFEAYGFGEMSQQETIAVCEKIFADHLGGHSLMTNANHIRGSAWIRFPRVLCARWSYDNIVLMGDAAATGAFLDRFGLALALRQRHRACRFLHSEPTCRRPSSVIRKSGGSRCCGCNRRRATVLEWFEEVERYLDLDPVQFNYSLLTRSQRISHENLRLRDAEWLEDAERWFQTQAERLIPGACTPADVRALQIARHGTQEPDRGLADGAVQGRRRMPDRLAPGALRRTRQGRRRPGLYRDDLRLAGRPDHAGLSWALCPGTRGGLAADRRFHPCRKRGQGLHADRPFRRQGIDPARLGDHGCRSEGNWPMMLGFRCRMVVRQPDTQGDEP
jgi:2-polyprenyl-6-methoxyphenol hydroxylase-like FAD-dependent oxidoreductase